MTASVILVRLAVLAVLYLFMLAVLRVVWRDLGSAVPVRRGGSGRAVLIAVNQLGSLRAGVRIPLEGAAGLGRDSDNQVLVADSTISGRHASLYFRDGRWWIEDLGSTNGTFVNQQRLTAPLVLASGDLIEVGRAAFRFSA